MFSVSTFQSMFNISTVVLLLALMLLSGTTAQDCGEAAGGALCEANVCCSKYSYCGVGSQYCGLGCQSQCNSTTNSTTTAGECGNQASNALCKNNRCCSEYGYCGVTSAYCGTGCQSQCSSNATAPLPSPSSSISPSPSSPSPSPSNLTSAPTPFSTSSSSKSLLVPLAIAVPLAVALCVSAAIACFACLKRSKLLAQTRPPLWDSKCVEAPFSRFSYADLSTATKGFSESLMLGKGGYGSVYKGILPGDKTEVAVKVMSVEGHQQFSAELSVIGLLRHKNLVGLRGWCHEHEKLILVYDYMPNGSLNQHLFSSDRLLTWGQRYEIAKGVAEGLAFLHGGWEQRIIHRDIKAANVLLDNNFVARLGDFGLSKLMQSTQSQQTMTMAGTFGYIAPELAWMGRASVKSDIYSYGILLLEMACGKPVLSMPWENPECLFLLEWVWQAQKNNDLLGVADVRLQSHYDVEQMSVMLSLGLLCGHPDAEQRPSIKRCCQILDGEAALPSLPNVMPTLPFLGSFQSQSASGANSTNSGKSTNSATLRNTSLDKMR